MADMFQTTSWNALLFICLFTYLSTYLFILISIET